MARLRAGLLMVDEGNYDDVVSRVQILANENNRLRHSAREALGLAAWKDGKAAEAEGYFIQLADDQAAPKNIGERAGLMLDVIKSSGKSAAKSGS